MGQHTIIHQSAIPFAALADLCCEFDLSIHGVRHRGRLYDTRVEIGGVVCRFTHISTSYEKEEGRWYAQLRNPQAKSWKVFWVTIADPQHDAFYFLPPEIRTMRILLTPGKNQVHQTDKLDPKEYRDQSGLARFKASITQTALAS